MARRVTNHDLDKRLTKLESDFANLSGMLKLLIGMVGTTFATVTAQLIVWVIKK